MEPDSSIPTRPAGETARVRRGFLILALAVAALFFLGTHHFWVAADSNVDENAYLVSGKLLAQTGSLGYAAPDPYTLVGMMWIGTPEGRFYPKYPLGQTLLVATAYKLFGWRSPFLINPILMTLGLLGVFLLIRDVVGSFGGLLGMIAMAMSPVLLAETNDPDSHAAAVCFTTWGMFLLLRWWRTGRHRHAALAGLLLGLSAITRYTEALALLPMALAALFQLGRRKDVRRSLTGVAALAAGWLLPVGVQVGFNLRVLHRLTGYGATHESTAFSAGYFVDHWGAALHQLCTLGLPFLFPLGLVGLLLLTWREWRLGLVLWAWTLPNLFLYIAYYWAPDDIAYTRFYLTIFPPLLLGIAWLLTQPLPGPAALRPWIRRAQPAVALVLVLACGAFGLREILPTLKSIHQDQQQAWNAGEAVRAVAPAGSVFFGPQHTLLYLQYAGDGYQLYSRNIFIPKRIARLGNQDPRAPNALQPERARALFKLLKGRKVPGMLRLQRALAADWAGGGRRVFLLAPDRDSDWTDFADPALNRLDGRSLQLRPVARWQGWETDADETGERPEVDWLMLEVTVRPLLSSPPS
jgi:4-amino-4-deoxy-L-arabinose transferase-like glycosyltransferase